MMTDTKYLTVELTTKDIERIFAKINIDPDDPLGKCWTWKGARTWYGYGVVWFHGRQEQAHRLMYAWLREPIPQGFRRDIQLLDHIVCDNPSCCNPFHLRLVLPVENILRTNSISSVNRRKTHCKRGHLLPTEPNRKDGSGRTCLICKKEQSYKYNHEVSIPKRSAERAKKRAQKPVLTEEERQEKKRQYFREYRKRKHQLASPS